MTWVLRCFMFCVIATLSSACTSPDRVPQQPDSSDFTRAFGATETIYEADPPGWYWHVSLPFHGATAASNNVAELVSWNVFTRRGEMRIDRLLGSDLRASRVAIEHRSTAVPEAAELIGFEFPLVGLDSLYHGAHWSEYHCWMWADRILLFQTASPRAPVLRVLGWARKRGGSGGVEHGGWVGDEVLDDVEIVRLRYIDADQTEWHRVKAILPAPESPLAEAEWIELSQEQSRSVALALGLK